MPVVFRRNKARDKTRKRPYWSYRIVCADGKKREFRGESTKAVTMKVAAEHEKREQQRADGTGEAEADISFDEAVEAYLAWGGRKGGRGGRSWSDYHAKCKARDLRHWKKRLRLRTLTDIRLIDVERWAPRLGSPKTAANQVEALHSLCRWAMRRHLLDRDPLAAWSPEKGKSKGTRALSVDEVRRLLEASPEKNALQYATAIWTGYRLGELRALTPADLDGRFLVLSEEHTKARKDARQPIPAWLAERLEEQAATLPDDVPLLQIPRGGASNYQIHRDRKAAGIAHQTAEGSMSWHSFRKTYTEVIVPHAKDPATLRALSRHSSADLLFDRYARSNDERKLSVIDLADASWVGGTLVAPNAKEAALAASHAGSEVWRIGDLNLSRHTTRTCHDSPASTEHGRLWQDSVRSTGHKADSPDRPAGGRLVAPSSVAALEGIRRLLPYLTDEDRRRLALELSVAALSR